MKSSLPSDTCPLCLTVGEYIEIENAQDASEWDVAESFPQEADQFTIPNSCLEHYYRYKNQRLLRCSNCGTYYWYREWAPGGSEDVLKTYIHESMRRLSFLEAHVELHDAQYQAFTRAKEYGGSFEDEYEITRQGVQQEMDLLKARCPEIVSDVIHSVENKHARSEQLEETLKLYAPHRDHTREIETQREKEEQVAVYHVGILAEYLQYWEPSTIPMQMIRSLVTLLADDNQKIREIIRDALIRVIRDATAHGKLASEILKVAQELAVQHAETQGLLQVCREFISGN